MKGVNDRRKSCLFIFVLMVSLNRHPGQECKNTQVGVVDVSRHSRWLELRARYRSTEDMIHTLFVCISGKCPSFPKTVYWALCIPHLRVSAGWMVSGTKEFLDKRELKWVCDPLFWTGKDQVVLAATETYVFIYLQNLYPVLSALIRATTAANRFKT